MLASLNRGVALVGTGARTPVGLNAPSTAASVRAGIAAMKEHPFMLDKESISMIVCADAMLPMSVAGADRLFALALPAAQEALKPLLKCSRDLPSIDVFLALPEQRPGRGQEIEAAMGARLAAALSSKIEVRELVCHSMGNAGGILCMEQAASYLVSGKSSICLVGGVDSYLEAETLEWLDSQEQLHSDSTIWGFCPSEGAGFCLLASTELAASLGLFASVELLTASSAIEPHRIRTEMVCIGQGLSEAFAKTLEVLPSESRVNNTICDMNGEPYGGNEYGFAVLRSPGKFADDGDFQTPADCWGNVGAASGPLFAVLATFAAHKEYSPGPFTLLWASSENGLRAAALLRGVFSRNIG